LNQVLDFYHRSGTAELAYLVFDSKFTTYENLARLDPKVKFITIRRRGKHIVKTLEALPNSAWQQVRVPAADGKGRTLRVNDSRVFLRDYGKDVRQVAITGHGKIKPALIITNDFEGDLKRIIRAYARRWLVEKDISEQIEFFHLNRLSSSIVIKVDFDLTMSILAHNLLRLFAQDLRGYEHQSAPTLYNKFLANSGVVEITSEQVAVKLHKKRALPVLLTAMTPFQDQPIRLWGNRTATFAGDTRS
jgi:IS4 transposase